MGKVSNRSLVAGWVTRNRSQIRLAVRMTAASFVAYGIGELLRLQQSQWAVLTSIIVMQASVGASLKAMLERFLGSLGGAVAGVFILLGLHRGGYSSPGLALLIGVLPLTLLASIKPTYRVAPITFIILVLTPNLQAMGPVEAAVQRMFEIAVGSVIALGVSLVVLPARAHDALAQAVANALSAMADLVELLSVGIDQPADKIAIAALHDRIRGFIGRAEVAAEEALRERSSHLTNEVDPLPICRTLRRLRHDFAILGRALAIPMPAAVVANLADPVHSVAAEVATFLRSSGTAFRLRAGPESLAELNAAFAYQSEAVTDMRRRGFTRQLPDDDLVRVFGMGFAFDQLRRDLHDLADRCAELAR